MEIQTAQYFDEGTYHHSSYSGIASFLTEKSIQEGFLCYGNRCGDWYFEMSTRDKFQELAKRYATFPSKEKN